MCKWEIAHWQVALKIALKLHLFIFNFGTIKNPFHWTLHRLVDLNDRGNANINADVPQLGWLTGAKLRIAEVVALIDVHLQVGTPVSVLRGLHIV